jgi:hypothetical protein
VLGEIERAGLIENASAIGALQAIVEAIGSPLITGGMDKTRRLGLAAGRRSPVGCGIRERLYHQNVTMTSSIS